MTNIRKITKLEVAALEDIKSDDLGRLYCVVDNEVQFVETRKVAIVTRDKLTPANPVEDWDMTGKIACWHREYTLGHVQPKLDPQEYRITLIEEFEPDFCDRLDARVERYQESLKISDIERKLTSVAEFTQDIVDKKFDEYYLSLPLYLCDLSGRTLSTGEQCCAWDPGQVGLIFLSKHYARTTWGWTKLTKSRIQHVHQLLKGEVTEYDFYLRGDAWEYRVDMEAWDPISEAWYLVESNLTCGGGFLGSDGDPVKTGILDHLELDIDFIENRDTGETYNVADLRSRPLVA